MAVRAAPVARCAADSVPVSAAIFLLLPLVFFSCNTKSIEVGLVRRRITADRSRGNQIYGDNQREQTNKFNKNGDRLVLLLGADLLDRRGFFPDSGFASSYLLACSSIER